MAAVTATGVPKPAAPSKKAPKEGNQQQLDAAVFGDAGKRILQHLEAAVLLGQLMQEDDVQHNPANGQQAGEAAEQGGTPRHFAGHVVDKDCNQQRCNQACACGQVGLHVQKPRPTSITTTGMAASNVDSHIFDRVVDLLPNHLCCLLFVVVTRMVAVQIGLHT
jgi:hypothetical protein